MDGFNSKNEYLDFLYYMDKNPGNRTFESYKDQIVDIIKNINDRYGNKMPSTRLCYLLMKFYNMKKYDAQRMIRYGLSKRIISIDDRLWNVLS